MSEASTREDREIRLRDGRRLGFAEYGDPKGVPCFYFHGWPSSRLEGRAAERVAARLGVRLIAPERPGYGLSDFKAHRTVKEWPADVSELAEHLGLGPFGVLGVSGGGPYAAACAALIPNRLTSVSLVCSAGPCDAPGALEGMVPLTRWLLTFARTTPWLAQKTATFTLRAIWGKGEQVLPRQIEARLPPADKRALENPELRATLLATAREAMRQGVEGAAWDGMLLSAPWGFPLEDIRIPVQLWHGEKDPIVPPGMGRHLARHIPNCHARFFAEDGHFSLPYGRVDEIVQTALGRD